MNLCACDSEENDHEVGDGVNDTEMLSETLYVTVRERFPSVMGECDCVRS
jgi:hypothetical protein